MKIPLEVSGTFCELRSNHFHFGMDFRTDGRENLELYSCAEGYVYRIKVDFYGYGKAVYIKHPNGYITLYGHLNEFSAKIKARVLEEQTKRQDFEFDLYLDSNEIPVERGEFIAYSGNTGSSQGGHLHFEIRDSTGNESINPLLFGLKVTDTRKPEFTSLSIYQKKADGSMKRSDYAVSSGKYGYYFKNGSSFTASGIVGIGFQAYDKQDATNYKNNIYIAEMYVNDTLKFKVDFDRLAFDESRYINSYTDYKETIKTGTFIQRCFIQENNLFNCYVDSLGNGFWAAADGQTYSVKLLLKDIIGNTQTLSFKITGSGTADYSQQPEWDGVVADGKSPVLVEKEFGNVLFPENSLYEKMPVNFYRELVPNRYGYPDYVLNDFYIPVHHNITISLKLNDSNTVPVEKLGLVYYNPGGTKNFYGGEVKDGYITCETNDLGVYTVMADTVSPTLSLSGIKDSSSMVYGVPVKFKIADDFSGIETYDIYIDGNWTLGEYEWKTKIIKVSNLALSSGWHTFRVVVVDRRGNITEKKYGLKMP